VTSDEDLDYQPVTSEQMYACAAVKARAHFRACVHRWLEREKQEPELRKERTSIFEDKMYARCNFVDQHECIIDALPEIGECACAASLGMPRAKCALPTSTRQVQAQVNLVRPVGANVSWYHRCARLEQIDSYKMLLNVMLI